MERRGYGDGVKVNIEESEHECMWAVDDAGAYECSPIATFKCRATAEAFVEWLSSDACPENVVGTIDAVVMPAFAPIVHVANHVNDTKCIAELAHRFGRSPSDWKY